MKDIFRVLDIIDSAKCTKGERFPRVKAVWLHCISKFLKTILTRFLLPEIRFFFFFLSYGLRTRFLC